MFKSHLYKIKAYQPPLEKRGVGTNILLDFNERTQPISAVIEKALIDYIRQKRLQVYPEYGHILQSIADYCKVQSDQIMLTNGSDQGLELVFRATLSAGDEVIIPEPSFALYAQNAAVLGARVVQTHYDKQKGFPLAQVLKAIHAQTRLIVLANPNNPTGTIIASEAIQQIVLAAPKAIVLVDECYFEYTQQSVVHWIKRYPNLVVTRTFSKTWGLASLRIGFVVSTAENINILLKIRGPYDVNQLAVIAAQTALAHPQDTQAYIQEVMQQSKPLLENFLNSRNISFWASSANFLWVFPSHAKDLVQYLKEQGVLVRPRAQDKKLGIRISIGTLAQTQKLIALLQSFPHPL